MKSLIAVCSVIGVVVVSELTVVAMAALVAAFNVDLNLTTVLLAIVAVVGGWWVRKTEAERKAAAELVAKKAEEAAGKVAEVATKAEEVKQALVETSAVVVEKLDNVAARVEDVHTATALVVEHTNSIVHQLVQKTEIEALARGTREEKARADTEKKETLP